MYKKLFSFLSLVVVLATLLAACGSPATPTAGTGNEPQTGNEPTQKVTLRVLVHQNPPMVAFMETFNQQFHEKHPNITVDMSVVNANELSTVSQTRLSANDIDVLDIFGFANAAQPYMKQVDPPNWQQLIEAGLLMDLTGQDFLKYCSFAKSWHRTLKDDSQIRYIPRRQGIKEAGRQSLVFPSAAKRSVSTALQAAAAYLGR